MGPIKIRKFLALLTSRQWPLPPPEASSSNPDQLDYSAALRVRKAQVDELRTRYIEFAEFRRVKLWLELVQRTMTVVEDILAAIELQASETRYGTEARASVSGTCQARPNTSRCAFALTNRPPAHARRHMSSAPLDLSPVTKKASPESPVAFPGSVRLRASGSLVRRTWLRRIQRAVISWTVRGV